MQAGEETFKINEQYTYTYVRDGGRGWLAALSEVVLPIPFLDLDGVKVFPHPSISSVPSASRYSAASLRSMRRLYVNGREVAEQQWPGGILQSNSQVTIGSDGPGFRPFRGLIDELRIYDRALPAEEICDVCWGTPAP